MHAARKDPTSDVTTAANQAMKLAQPPPVERTALG